MHAAPYNNETSKQVKMTMTREIVKRMNNQFNSRFLKQNKAGDWEEISTAAARDKVSHALRFAARQVVEQAALAAGGFGEKNRPKTQAAYQAEARSRLNTISVMAQVQKREMGKVKVEVEPPPTGAHLSQDETEFNSMRTADLEEILGEPLKEDEWEAVSALAMVNNSKKSKGEAGAEEV